MTLKNTQTLYHIVAPMEGVEVAQLRRVAAELMQRRGEYTACGEVLLRAIEALYPEAPREPAPKALGIDDAYGDMTFPLGGGK